MILLNKLMILISILLLLLCILMPLKRSMLQRNAPSFAAYSDLIRYTAYCCS